MNSDVYNTKATSMMMQCSHGALPMTCLMHNIQKSYISNCFKEASHVTSQCVLSSVYNVSVPKRM